MCGDGSKSRLVPRTDNVRMLEPKPKQRASEARQTCRRLSAPRIKLNTYGNSFIALSPGFLVCACAVARRWGRRGVVLPVVVTAIKQRASLIETQTHPTHTHIAHTRTLLAKRRPGGTNSIIDLYLAHAEVTIVGLAQTDRSLRGHTRKRIFLWPVSVSIFVDP